MNKSGKLLELYLQGKWLNKKTRQFLSRSGQWRKWNWVLKWHSGSEGKSVQIGQSGKEERDPNYEKTDILDLEGKYSRQTAQLVENLPAMQETTCTAGNAGSTSGLGRSPGEGNGNPLQYSCLGNCMDRGVRRATVHRVTKSRTRLSDSTTTVCLPCGEMTVGARRSRGHLGDCSIKPDEKRWSSN